MVAMCAPDGTDKPGKTRNIFRLQGESNKVWTPSLQEFRRNNKNKQFISNSIWPPDNHIAIQGILEYRMPKFGLVVLKE